MQFHVRQTRFDHPGRLIGITLTRKCNVKYVGRPSKLFRCNATSLYKSLGVCARANKYMKDDFFFASGKGGHGLGLSNHV
jgi:hypothetical protein